MQEGWVPGSVEPPHLASATVTALHCGSTMGPCQRVVYLSEARALHEPLTRAGYLATRSQCSLTSPTR
jgi:hypothetical protein